MSAITEYHCSKCESEASCARTPMSESYEIEECADGQLLYESKELLTKSLLRLCYGNLYMIGTLWIRSLRYALVGANMCIFPVVKASRKEEPPKKPPPMKYKDLPMNNSPHSDYNDYYRSKPVCNKVKVKLIHSAVRPYVSEYRKCFFTEYKKASNGLISTFAEVHSNIRLGARDVNKYFRDPNHEQRRLSVVGAGGILGYLLTRNKTSTKKHLGTGAGAIAGALLSYPEETHKGIRKVCYFIVKTINKTFCKYRGIKSGLLEEGCFHPPKVTPPDKYAPTNKCIRPSVTKCKRVKKD